MMPPPQVTVLMPVFNGARYLRASIDSILAQTFEDFELLIVDDGSTDDSRAVARSFDDRRIRIVEHDRNRGLSATLNHGLEIAGGDLIARQDQDDLSTPTRLAQQLAFLGHHPDVALLGSQARAIDADGRPLEPVDRPVDDVSIRWYALVDNPFIHSSVMFRRQVAWQQSGGFDGSFSEDWVLWVRIMGGHAVANLPDRLVTYRVHSASIIGSIDSPTRSIDEPLRSIDEPVIVASDDRSDKAGNRARFEAGVHELVSRQVREMFAADGVSVDDAALMARFIPGVAAGDLERFLSVFRRLLHLYQERHPACRESADFPRTLARQFDAIAYRIIGGSRTDVVSVYRAALAEDAALWRELSWPRALALVLLGREGRAHLGQSGPARALRAIRQSHHG